MGSQKAVLVRLRPLKALEYPHGVRTSIAWMTRLLATAERTIAQLHGDERRCLVLSQGERWTLPLGAEKLRVGQKIRVSFREIAPLSALEPGREVVEVRAIAD